MRTLRARTLRALLLDAYGTLLDTEGLHGAACRGVLARVGPPDLDPEALHARWDAHLVAGWRNEHRGPFVTQADVLRRGLVAALAELGIDAADPGLCDPYLAAIETSPPYPEVPAALTGLRRSYRLVVVSNADQEALEAHLARAGLSVDAVVTSELARAYKPDPRIFEAGLEAAGVGPQQAVYVGDSELSDLAGARRVGLPAIWVNRAGKRLRDPANRPAATITDLSALRPALEAIEAGDAGAPAPVKDPVP